MPPSSAPFTKDYHPRAASWAQDQQDGLRRSRTVAWALVGVLALACVSEAIALAALAPLKTVVPYTVLVDRHTGYQQVIKGLEPEAISADAALTQAHLAQYVIAREGFDAATLGADYRKVALWSADGARRDYLTVMAKTNPVNPMRVYPRDTVVSTTIKSVSNLGPQTALVRFETKRSDAGRPGAAPEPWAAVVRFRYVGGPRSLDDRLANPLGFQVIGYKRSQEASPAASAVQEPVS